MTVRLRLQRKGTRKRPFYRVVAADQRAPRDGRYIEQLGVYDPLQDPMVVSLDIEKVQKWLSTGAQPTDTVAMLIRKVGAGETKSIDEFEAQNREAKKAAREAARKGVAVPKAAEPAPAAAAPEAPAAEAPAPEAAADASAE